MSRYESLFNQCERENRIAFIPFVMLGDPDDETTLAIVDALVAGGADALELGIPFSDPVADGPVIQASAIRALTNGATPQRSFELLETIRQKHADIPIGLLLYANLVYHDGIHQFYQRCQSVGVDSVLIADVPTRECDVFDQAAKTYDVESVHILPPQPSESVVMNVAKRSQGYTYVLGRAGVTGTDVAAVMPEQSILNQLQEYGAAPPVMGFGISKPDQVLAAKQAGFKGAISGSAVVKIIEKNLTDRASMTEALKQFVQSMKQAAKG